MRAAGVLDGFRLTFKNYVITKEKILQIRNEIKYERNKHGLNLLNTMANILYGRDCEIGLHMDEYELSIPIMKG